VETPRIPSSDTSRTPSVSSVIVNNPSVKRVSKLVSYSLIYQSRRNNYWNQHFFISTVPNIIWIAPKPRSIQGFINRDARTLSGYNGHVDKTLSVKILCKLFSSVWQIIAEGYSVEQRAQANHQILFSKSAIPVRETSLRKIIFSDKAHLRMNGYMWIIEIIGFGTIPIHTRYTSIKCIPRKSSVWWGFWSGVIVGPYFFQNDTGIANRQRRALQIDDKQLLVA